jgi:hypothetical protein
LIPNSECLTPEQRAREKIDAMLAAAGWAVQTKDQINRSASRGVAICELSFATGEPDFIGWISAPGFLLQLASFCSKSAMRSSFRRMAYISSQETAS